MSGRGRMRLVRALMTGSLEPSPLLNDRLVSCILCGACSSVCPLNINIPELILQGLRMLRKQDKKRRNLRYLLKIATTWPQLSFRVLSMGQDFLLPFLSRRGLLPFRPEIPDQPFHALEQVHKVQKKKGRVAIFTGCSVNYLFPHLGESLINVLQSIGYEVVLPKDEVCCGAPLRGLGMEEEAAELARNNYRVFSRLRIDAILSLCPTCTMTLKHDYRSLIGKGLDKAMDSSVFLLDRLERVEAIDRTVTYHDPCHLQYSLGIKKEPRDIIIRAGLGLVEPQSQGCCGFGGTFCLSNKELSGALALRQAGNLLETGAETIVTSCPGCIMQLRREIQDRPVIHLIELIEEAYCLRKLYQEPVLAHKG